MTNLTVDIAALEQLPETDATGLLLGGSGGGCGSVTCVITCVVTGDVENDRH